MKTVNELRKMSRDGYREYAKSMREAVKKLDELQRAHDTPRETVAAFIESVGADKARAVIASLVNASSWDGRIFPSCASWAEGIEDACDEGATRELWMFTSMHMCHLNQICMEIMRT